MRCSPRLMRLPSTSDDPWALRRALPPRPACAAGSWPVRSRCACADGADATDGADAAGKLPAGLQAARARPRHLAARRAAHALDRQALRAGDHASAIRRVLSRRLASKAPRHDQCRRQNDDTPARGEGSYVAERAAHPLAGTGPVITHSI